MKTPQKSKKYISIFRHLISVFHLKIFATVFWCFIAGECDWNVNIHGWRIGLKAILVKVL